MSLILDALRKMEQERRARRQDSAALRTEVLNYRGNSSDVKRSRVLPYSAMALILIAAVGGWYFFMPKKDASAQKNISVVQVRQPVSEPAAMPPIPAPVTPHGVPPVAVPDIPSVKGVSKVVSPASTITRMQTQAAVAQKNGDNGITLSGIAWQEERHLRRAVINGFLMEEGGEVQGAKIVEIRENRVRFSKGGEFFEVIHSSGMTK
ncbi:MAG: hypothetical protein HXX17_14070 [Geobacteraceae bacterium]|nr:hypothetical protein [Geobacteraceae bacterium]